MCGINNIPLYTESLLLIASSYAPLVCSVLAVSVRSAHLPWRLFAADVSKFDSESTVSNEHFSSRAAPRKGMKTWPRRSTMNEATLRPVRSLSDSDNEEAKAEADEK